MRGEVVQEAEARVVGVVRVIDHEQQSGAGRGEPHELGRGDEQPLMSDPAAADRGTAGRLGGLAGARRLVTAPSPVDLRAVRVIEPVEQRRMPAAEVGHGLEHRCVRPGALDRGGTADAAPPAERGRVRAELLDERGLAGSRRPGDEHGSPSAGADRAEQVGEDLELVLASDQSLVERRRRRGGMRQDREDLVPQPCRLLARDHAELVTQGTVHALVLAERGPPIAAGDVRAHQCDVRFLVGRLFGEECVPALRAAKERHVEAARVFAARVGPRLVGVGRQ